MNKYDFSKGSITKHILSLAIPMTVAQLINVLYNIVDRVYIGQIPQTGTLALTGLGLCFPIITIATAFSSLVGTGGSPLFSIERGKGNTDHAHIILGNSFILLILFGLTLTILGLIFKKPLLYLFGASDNTYIFANDYLSIYLIGTTFQILALGLNYFINAQGFSTIGMLSVIIGAVINIILDPLFIYFFNMGVSGAALASIISQAISLTWILSFLCSKKSFIRLRPSYFKLNSDYILKIISLGTSGFVMQITNSIVQIICNSTLSIYGGDLYIGVMTIINSIREVISLPAFGLTNGGQPVLSYNYGAGCKTRVKKIINFMTFITLTYTFFAWGIMYFLPGFFIRIFNQDPTMINATIPALKIYFFGFFMMSFQFAGQSTFVGLGKSKQAIFFSIFRKVIVVVPLTLILPRFLGVMGVFYAEPISNFIGGLACYLTMRFTISKELS